MLADPTITYSSSTIIPLACTYIIKRLNFCESETYNTLLETKAYEETFKSKQFKKARKRSKKPQKRFVQQA
ncbi:hypothetical protein Hanom_Chr09g00818331 [Helianthus anomalus]